jgi:hypothetical protein
MISKQITVRSSGPGGTRHHRPMKSRPETAQPLNDLANVLLHDGR